MQKTNLTLCSLHTERGDDTTVTLLDDLYQHLEGPSTHARLLFVDFSLAFNTVQPHLLAEKLLNAFNLEFNTTGWIMDFLSKRP